MNKANEDVNELSCLNCNRPFQGDEVYCATCGQKNIHKKLKFRALISEFLAGFISYDKRLWKSLYYLFLKPSKITSEYINGKRARFVNPYKFYFSVSIIFFLLNGFYIHQYDKIYQEGVLEESILADSIGLNFSLLELDMKKGNQVAVIDSLDMFHFIKNNRKLTFSEAAQKIPIQNNFWNRFKYQKIKDTLAIQEQGARDFISKVSSYLPITLFLILPFFALSFKLFYSNKRHYYMEHLVFCFHAQTLLFLYLLFFTILNFFLWGDPVSEFPYLFFLMYLFIALKRYYQQGWIKTILKFLLLNLTFMTLALIGFLFVSAFTFLMY